MMDSFLLVVGKKLLFSAGNLMNDNQLGQSKLMSGGKTRHSSFLRSLSFAKREAKLEINGSPTQHRRCLKLCFSHSTVISSQFQSSPFVDRVISNSVFLVIRFLIFISRRVFVRRGLHCSTCNVNSTTTHSSVQREKMK